MTDMQPAGSAAADDADDLSLRDVLSDRFVLSQEEGDLHITDRQTGAEVPIVDGIPRFVSGQNYADSFGFQWNRFRSTQLDSQSGVPLSFERFWRNTGWKPRELFGRKVLEAGSGAGRFTEVMLDSGAQVTSFDFSSAVDANRKNNADKGFLRILQADIYDMPFREAFFDYVFCYGVLQHLPDPSAAFQALVSRLAPGGRISVDLYLKTSRLDPFNQPKYFWRRWTTGLPPERLYRIIASYMPCWLPIDTVIRRIPYFGPKILGFLRVPCWNYTRSGLSKQQRYEWALLDTFDALSAAYDKPFTLQEAQRMASAIPGLCDVKVFYGSNGVVINARRAD